MFMGHYVGHVIKRYDIIDCSKAYLRKDKF